MLDGTMSSHGQSPTSTGSEHEAFTAWSRERGVTISAVLAARIPGRGLGIVAERRIEVNQPRYALQQAEYETRPARSSSMCLPLHC